MFKRIKLWWLIHRLQSKDAKVRAASAGALGMLGDRRAVEPLIAVLKKPSIIKQTSILVPSVSGDTLVSTSVALALRKLGDPRTVEFLIATLRGSDGQGRSSVQVVLGTLGDPQAVEPLIATLKDPDQAVRCSAVEVLGTLGDPRAVESLIAALKDDSTGTFISALVQLSDLRTLDSLNLVDMLVAFYDRIPDPILSYALIALKSPEIRPEDPGLFGGKAIRDRGVLHASGREG